MKIPKPVKLITRTPIHLLEGLEIRTRIYIKRDDLNGLLISGNMIRSSPAVQFSQITVAQQLSLPDILVFTVIYSCVVSPAKAIKAIS
jgi:hypothetical protein